MLYRHQNRYLWTPANPPQGTGKVFLPWVLEDACAWEPGAPSSTLRGTQPGDCFLSKSPCVLQTPTTQLLAGEVLSGFLQAPVISVCPRNQWGFVLCPVQLIKTHVPTVNQTGFAVGWDALCTLGAVMPWHAAETASFLCWVTCSNHPLLCRGPQDFLQRFAPHGPCCGVGALLRAWSSTWAGARLGAAVLGWHFGIAQPCFALMACSGPLQRQCL